MLFFAFCLFVNQHQVELLDIIFICPKEKTGGKKIQSLGGLIGFPEGNKCLRECFEESNYKGLGRAKETNKGCESIRNNCKESSGALGLLLPYGRVMTGVTDTQYV